MRFDITTKGAFGSVIARLAPGETLVSDSGAMYRASGNVEIDVSTRATGGGLLAGLKRLVSSDTFFQSTYRLSSGSEGEVGLAPVHQGEVRVVELDGKTAWLCTGGSYLGSTGLTTEPKFQGLKGLFSGESVFFLRVTGAGSLLVSAFGRIVEIDVTEPMVVDTGHVVAYEETLEYTMSRAGGSWISSWLAGEGFVFHFRGRGKLLIQSHNPKEFGQWLGPRLPMRE